MEQIIINAADISTFKKMSPWLANSYEQGACLLICNKEHIMFKHSSRQFDISLQEGDLFSCGVYTDRILHCHEVIDLPIDQSVYGVFCHIQAGPLMLENSHERIGSWILIMPRVHPLARSFDSLGEILLEQFPDGAVFNIIEEGKYACIKSSSKIPGGFEVGDNAGIEQTSSITNKKMMITEQPPDQYGVCVTVVSYPLMDDNSDAVSGAFSAVIIKDTGLKLKQMAGNLSSGLQQISAATQELSASAEEFSHNQNRLAGEISDIGQQSRNINEVLEFIKQIAAETKMLGLNASIEAARAGEIGRGFGVVAQEIRKLSDQSKQTAGQIYQLTELINHSIDTTSHASQSSLVIIGQVAAAAQEVSANIQDLVSLADELLKLSETR